MIKNNIRQVSKMVSIILILTIILGIVPMNSYGQEEFLGLDELRSQYGAISVEAYNLGQGFLVEPTLYKKEDKPVGDITVQVLEEKGVGYTGSTSYFKGFEFNDTTTPNYPEYLSEYEAELEDSGDGDGYLSEFDYSSYAGWCYTIDDWWASWGAADAYPGREITDYNTKEKMTLGDVIRWHFTVYGYGADCGFPGNVMSEYMGGNLFVQEDKTDLIFTLAAINDYYGNLTTDDVYENALSVAADPLASAEDIAAQEKKLTDYIEESFLSDTESEPQVKDVSAILNATMAQLASTVTEPVFGSVAGEWTVLSLARGEYLPLDNTYFTQYYERIEEYVNTTAPTVSLNNGALARNKSTDNSRLILALSSIGKDATKVGDWNLITPFNDFSWIKRQGINGPIFALLALDSNNYQTTDETIRQQSIDFILEKEISGGGWALSGTTADPDITAMALQALAPYKDQSAVAEAADRAFNKLSSIQNEDGGFFSWGTLNPESSAQVIVATTAWGINPDSDSRFVKNDKSVVDAMLTFYLEDSASFEHTHGGGSNPMATDQACYALVSYNRYVNNKTHLYDYSDVSFEKSSEVEVGKPKAYLDVPAHITAQNGNSFNATLSIDQWNNDAGYKLIDFVVNVPKGLTVTEVTSSELLNGGEVNYNLEAETGKLRVVYFDANNHSDLKVNGSSFPAELFTITFKTESIKEGDKLNISVAGMSLKLHSDSTADDSMVIVDIAKASGTVGVVKGIAFSAASLYVGDGIDLIPTSKRAVAVYVAGINEGSKVSYNDNANTYDFKYSSEISEKTGISTYVVLVDSSIDMSQFVKKENYTVSSDKSEEIRFGDSNSDGIINAQDALVIVDSWLRKTEEPSENQILAQNVNSDSRINTFDALGIVESFVNGSDFNIVTKAASFSNND